MNVPGEQGELDVEPVEHAEPAGHEVQSKAAASPILLEYVPARHGSCADAPRGQKFPPVHVLHPVEPLASWKLPAVHALHSEWPVTAVKVPGVHGVFDVEPVLQLEPAGQAVHSPALLRFAAFE